MPSPRGMQSPGTLLQNRYRVVSQIGEGGMGAVYVATDERFGSTVALKETFFSDASLRRAFEREAQLLNRLRHPALPKVSDHFGESDGQFLVMEFIAGADLAEMLDARDEPFPVADVLQWADDLLDALDYLHTQEPAIVHRDIKPQNLKLTPRGHVVLLDFGLAKGSLAQTSQATKSVFGYSRNYAPLEQIQGAGTDFRSDLYSLGATLYHLLTNHVPADALTRAMAVLNNQPDPLRPADELNPQVSPAIGAVVARAMSQTAAARQQSAAEMREELRRAAHDVSPAPARPATRAAGGHDARTTPMPSEQETRLFGAHARGTTAGEAGGRETVRAGEAPAASGETTMVGGAASGAADAPTRVMHGARGTEAFAAVSHAPDARATGAETVASKRGGRSRLAGGAAVAAALGLVALLAGAFGVYKFTQPQAAPGAGQRPATEAARPSGAQDAGAPAAAPAAAAPTAQPQGAQTPGSQDAPPPVQPAQPSSPSTAAERGASPARAPNRSSREPDETRVGAGEEAGPRGREDSGAGAPDAFDFNFNAGGRGTNRVRRPGGGVVVVPPGGVIPPGIDWESLTPEQRRLLTERIRRGAEREHRRALDEMRRNQQRIPTPPTPRPVPTRQP